MSTLGLPAGKAGLPRSLRKHVRTEKARIRREVFDLKKQEELIGELYKKVGAVMNPVRGRGRGMPHNEVHQASHVQ